MKIAESWLREWVNPGLDTEALGHQLTMLGHEVDGIEYEGTALDGVQVAEVLDVRPHPDADRLRICTVSTGAAETIEVVCGAPNVYKGMKSALATPGVTLPNGVKLRKSKIRGVVSNGMLCSAIELGLGEEADGILDLPADAAAGTPFAAYLELPDAVIDIDLTPNRGDCFSVLGIARDVAALTGAVLKNSDVEPVAATIESILPVAVADPAGCPAFAGRLVRGIDPGAVTPLWMVERLRRSGFRAIHPVVDITNFVMLELGQPMHGYDAALVQGGLLVRLAVAGESVDLLDGKTVSLQPGTLVVTDDSGPVGLAGIMGGAGTAVSDQTVDVFFEAAFWSQDFMAGRARSYSLHTDASLRFERGVDPDGQARAVERATGLLLEIAGGNAGPLVLTESLDEKPKRAAIVLREEQLAKLLGVTVDAADVSDILDRLGLANTRTDSGWEVLAPSHRFDIVREVDLIEEVARIYGYDRIPEHSQVVASRLLPVTETSVDSELAAATLVSRDYTEVITYSFVDADDDRAINGSSTELVLDNPISSEMSVMRSSLWSGLLRAAAGNLARQQDRVRFFEIGKSFHGSLQQTDERLRLGGLACGPAFPEQWGIKSQPIDFFDIKSDVQALLRLAGTASEFSFAPLVHPALQPGQAAEIFRNGDAIGVMGKLHPRHNKQFGLKSAVYLFELDADKTLAAKVPIAKSVSRFPTIRRDIAVLVQESVTAEQLSVALADAAPGLIQTVRIFDIYQGAGVEAGLKSVAIGLILQETSRTLTDQDADAAQAAAVQKLHQEFAAVLRD
ncbi:MAG TPA: phenylalanine--tRNA ligase subunit beta [Woeseiaceae bacterium]|nr:phenylalanine--tRNA ligase subunit beta [Woeseiaceae bacterium]